MAAPATVRLRDGRRLAYREYGDVRGGFPVLFFHGNLGSRVYAAAWDKEAAETVAAGARVIAIDRPGVGGSDPHPARTYATWARDVGDFAAALQLRRFAVLGFSSGGVHACAVAAAAGAGDPALAGVAAVGLVSSDGPYWLLGRKPVPAGASEKVCAATAKQLRTSYAALKPARKAIAIADLDAAVVQGYAGPAQDTVMETHEWGIDFAAAGRFGDGGRRLFLWHGEKDADVEPKYAREHVRQLGAGVTAEFVAGESHSMLRRRWRAALQTLIAAAKPAPRL